MHPQLETIAARLESARDYLHAIAARTPADRWTKRSDPNRWSVGECVIHLNLTSEAYVPLIREALDTMDVVAANERPYRRDLVGYLLGYAVGPMPRFLRRRMRFATSARFVPQGDTPRDAAVAEFDRLQSELVALTRRADGRAIDRVRIASPFDARAKYNVYSALVVIPRHQQRHLIQAEGVWAGA